MVTTSQLQYSHGAGQFCKPKQLFLPLHLRISRISCLLQVGEVTGHFIYKMDTMMTFWASGLCRLLTRGEQGSGRPWTQGCLADFAMSMMSCIRSRRERQGLPSFAWLLGDYDLLHDAFGMVRADCPMALSGHPDSCKHKCKKQFRLIMQISMSLPIHLATDLL